MLRSGGSQEHARRAPPESLPGRTHAVYVTSCMPGPRVPGVGRVLSLHPSAPVEGKAVIVSLG
eukprot:2083206-Alexandrium_andersonii.AAC.1